MKKILLLPLLFLLFTASAQAGNKQAASGALEAHKKAAAKISQARFSATFSQRLSRESSCLASTLEGIDNSPTIDGENKEYYRYLFSLIFTLDYYVAASKDRGSLLSRQVSFLMRKKRALHPVARGKGGATILQSLRAHVSLTRFYWRGVDFSFCALDRELAAAGEYSDESISAALEKVLTARYQRWLESSVPEAASKKIKRSVGVMQRLGISSARVKDYVLPLPLALGAGRYGRVRSVSPGAVYRLLPR